MGEEPLRVLVIANKTWECEPMVGVLAGKRPRPRSLALAGPPSYPTVVSDAAAQAWKDKPVGPAPRNSCPPFAPRLRLTSAAQTYAEAKTPPPPSVCPEEKPPAPPAHWLQTVWRMEVEVWCIEDWMTHATIVSSSSSLDKWMRALPAIHNTAFAPGAPGGEPVSPDLVIAMGTAGMPSDDAVNGCVTVGSNVVVSDPFAGPPERHRPDRPAINPDARLDLGVLGLDQDPARPGVATMKGNPLKPDLLRTLPDAVRFAESCFLAPPLGPAAVPRIFAGAGFTALSTINVTNYDDYIWTDALTRTRFEHEFAQHEIGSMETTHGLIQAAFPASAFLYVSGITDRMPLFNQEVTPRVYAQNFACAHNAGVTVAFLLPALFDLHRQGALVATRS